ncbi:MAG: MurR/RpiR family transcriptional regulator [Eubacteriales bacterium]
MVVTSMIRDIQLYYNQFTKTEKKIADYVMEHSEEILFMSITDLADACKVADASVHRFCRTIGIKGYQEFKMKLSLSINMENSHTQETGKSIIENPTEATFEDTMKIGISVLEETRKLLKVDDVEKAVTMMEESKRIYFFGIGDSLLSAREARNKFLRITNKVNCIDDPHMQAMVASMAGPEDLFIFISYSGSTKDNVYVTEIAQGVGAKIIAISRFLKSPLTNFTDVLLLCGVDEGPLEGGSIGAKFAQLYIIDVLFKEFYRRSGEIAKINQEKTCRAVVEKLF